MTEPIVVGSGGTKILYDSTTMKLLNLTRSVKFITLNKHKIIIIIKILNLKI